MSDPTKLCKVYVFENRRERKCKSKAKRREKVFKITKNSFIYRLFDRFWSFLAVYSQSCFVNIEFFYVIDKLLFINQIRIPISFCNNKQ